MAELVGPVDGDWVSQYADEVLAEAKRRGAERIVVASGLSPSGPIHLGNLRELITPHLVADEIRRRAMACVHVLSWDDYDRFRKVPAGVDPSWSEHIGKPLTEVPPPPGSTYDSWAAHFIAPMIAAMAELGIQVHPVSQTAQYTSGAYRDQILLAMRERGRIDAILDTYRTKRRTPVPAKGLSEQDAAAAELAAEGSGAAGEDDGASSTGYYPYKPYCTACGKDTTTITAYDDDTTEMSFTCACGHSETVRLREFNHGKLVWKVDWPMRWAYEGVLFEPSGVDHSSPGSSFVVGSRICPEIFDAQPPIGPMYAFVGISGMAKMSSSRGAVPTPSDALELMEAPPLRWLYARRTPNQAFDIAFDQQLQRLYDEWDALGRRMAAGTAGAQESAAYRRAAATAAGALPTTPRPLPFGTLASIVDVTTNDPDQTLRILRELDPTDPVSTLDDCRPRLDRAQHWVATQVPPEQRTRVLASPDAELLARLDEDQRDALRLLRDGLAEHWSLERLTTLVYAVPKIQLGLPLEVKPTPELRVAQRAFFALVYRLLVGRDTGPRLPTLLLVVGAERARRLLGG